ncbi:arginine--tRNA ligase [Rhodospirillum rubrum]|uniref:Arginine--tRNA ligase n=1 Tax=Rhodospirillum rubrum (strain ATCC 11170 / ATH 1.1.1 / DSM 467 / LMG 4362 / NCIMB 8255 / S1) TaxID=269796 RepID=SYR_RHORT|nr:arginine--tRNA ligase [Rhodospirillum rubrum]Q2RTG6.1 RecName: Full=Arginine--tRNA ligase; AltName: Full=Arginyl-tRNA synthetase; Short=ArgRS [Rhodospirillum rubrum ATCC 11170]ABC22579.1 arginyl-tRNA synthetase [Rhodospirillum rubrum ATCC 11170]AEO48297.1 arginyl-tRNA synthetase [Rhodospirillum rubrum F11]MBK5954168.1 arginine--tRNA ligase [Rhodospirillum rubrum]QXG82205.1 arginine--tRNA ligase [Rhodospirillum rubrum]HCF18394.1 arginine--tRNA ligase [Rhodospirillum rubrum]
MNVFHDIKETVLAQVAALQAEGRLPEGLETGRVAVEPPREAAHGDMATNAAMVLAKPAGLAPRAVAEMLVEKLVGVDGIVAAETAGPGFINLRLDPKIWRKTLKTVLTLGTAFGASTMGRGAAVNVEFVSANPTGPMHVGHGRGAVFGDALAALLVKAGWAVTREYYVNDAGAQVDSLARALYARYRVAVGDLDEAAFAAMLAAREIEYGGDYLVPVAADIAQADGTRWTTVAESDWLPAFRAIGIERMLALIKEDLAALGVVHDVFTSEQALVRAGRVDEMMTDLESRDLVYVGTLEPPKGKTPDDWEPRPQTLFRATGFGDEVDRPLKKSDGSWTYFASDIAYHHDKFKRGFLGMINVLGADHGGYVKRLKAAVKAVSNGEAELDVKLVQLVKLLDNGEPVKMSKRAGTFITLREVVDEVGKDVVRFIMLTRKNDAALDFDYARVTEKTRDNPVFYVQYAHARACSVARHAAQTFPGRDLSAAALAATADLDLLDADEEMAMVRLLAGWPRLVESAAEAHEPHRVAFYLGEVAAAFHGLWNRGNDNAELRFLLPTDEARSLARLALVQAVASVIASGLEIFGVEPVKEMR